MRRHRNESSVTTASRIIPIPPSIQQAQFIDRWTSCSSVKTGGSSDSVMIATSSPCGTPPRKRWEGAFNKFLRGKDPQNSPTLSSSPSTCSAASIPIAEDLSTGTAGSASSSSSFIGGGTKGAKKKSSFSLIPGSKRLVSRNGSYKSGHNGRFSRGHKSMDALDIPLRKGSEKAKPNAGTNSSPASPSRTTLLRRERSSPLPSPVATEPPSTSEGGFCGIGLQSEQERRDNMTMGIVSTTPLTVTSALNDELRACSISSTHSYLHPNNQQVQLLPADWHTNPIVNQGVQLPLSTASAPSLTQLHPRRSHSRTYVYTSNSNSSTPVQQYHQDELDLRMMPQFPSLRGSSNHNRASLSDFHDVGLNLDDSDNCHIDDANQNRQDQMQPHLILESNNPKRSLNNVNNTTVITDSGVPEPPETLDEILGSVDGMFSVHSYSSSQLLSKMEHQVAASPETKKAFTKIHNSSEYGQDISPFLGGNKASNLDLAGAHKSCIATQQSMLLRSISSNQNIHSAMRMQFAEGSHNSPSTFLSQSLPLDTDKNPIHNGARLLKPIQSADSWVQGRRYLIAPAALAACPLSTIKSLTGLRSQTAMEASTSVDPPNASGVIELGNAFMTYVGDKYHLTCGKWSSCKLVLRQNYLFEYDLSAPLNSLPRGIAHLQHAVAYTQQDFQDAIELHFYASPCAKVDHRVLLIRVKNKDERDHWITCLNKAARLRIGDLWEYEEDRPLGTGRYASIFPARRKMPKRTNDKEEEHRCDQERVQNDESISNVALKIIDKNEFWRLVVKGRERCDTIVRELAVQSTLTAKFGTKPTFLQIHGFFETSEKVVIELELLEGKDLFDYISSKGVLEEEEAGLIIRDVLVALNSMSRAGIAHRDIKPANILMTRCDENKYGTAVKLGDFGMSTLVGVDGLLRGRCGSPGYVAPEILKAEAGEGYRNQVDMFSTGVTLYLMLCGYEPFFGETEKELIKANKKADVDFPDSEWSKISPEAKDLVAQMLKTDPKKRITTEDAIKHPWIDRVIQEQKRYSSCRPENTDITHRNSELGGVCSIM